MNENSNLKKEKEKENSLTDVNNYINNNILNFPLSTNFNNLIEISTGKNNKKITLHILEKKIFAKFNIKYKIKYNSRKIYNDLIMYTLLFNKNTHLVSLFKDYMIYDYVDEFLKRYYQSQETEERLPKFAIFYKNYLTFFCQPCFTSFKYNNLIQRNREKKAELFYNKNFREKNKESNEDEGIIEESEDDEEYETGKTLIEKTIFNETVKKYIDKYSPVNSSMNLPESETKLKSDESGLLTSFDNQSSLRNIVKIMKKIKKKDKNKDKDLSKDEISEIHKRKEKIDNKIIENKEPEKLKEKMNKINYNHTNKYKFTKKNYNVCEQNKEPEKKESKINSINNSNKKPEKYNNEIKEINIIKLKNKKENINIIKNEDRISPISSLANTNNKNKQPIYIKKIEMIKINKARSNSNRNSNLKENRNSNINMNNNNNDRNKIITMNHSQNILNIIQHIKNLDNHKKVKSEVQPYKKIKNNMTTDNTNNNKLKKNFSEKDILNNNNNKININTKTNHKKVISRNKRKNDNISELEKINDANTKNNNIINCNKIKTYYGLYHRKTISKEKRDTKVPEDFKELKIKTKNLNSQNNNNSNIIINSSNTENIKRQSNTSNLSQIQTYQNMTKSRNNNIN